MAETEGDGRIDIAPKPETLAATASGEQKGEAITFPLHPGKKRIYVRKKVKDSATKEENGLPTEKKSKGRKVLVAHTLSKKDIALVNEGLYDSPLGAVSPTKKTGELDGAVLNKAGRIVPYTILGSVEDFTKHGGHAKVLASRGGTGLPQTSQSTRRKKRATSSRRASRNVEQLRSQLSKASLHSNDGTKSVASANLSKDEFLRKVREQISRETEERTAALQAIEEEEMQKKMSNMLVHEKLAFDRQARALQAWKSGSASGLILRVSCAAG